MTPNNNNGGAICSYYDNSKANISNSQFIGNIYGGGAISLGEGYGVTIIDSCKFKNNTATAAGGAIEISSALNSVNVTISKSSFINNNCF